VCARPEHASTRWSTSKVRVWSSLEAVPLAWRASLSQLTLRDGKRCDDAAAAVAVKGALLQLPSLTHLDGVPSMSSLMGLLSAAEAGGLKHLTKVSCACEGPLPNAAALLLAAWLKRQVESGATPFSVAGVGVGVFVVHQLITEDLLLKRQW
jgi:hypothetical protein